ncbi:MAG: DNA repair protein RecO, partial [Candidatus Omnitrophota bacterium]
LGFILKRRDFRETSLIANLYTLRFGKITGIFKGFYTLKKEFSSSLDLFSLNEFIFYPKRRQIWLISFADLVCDYPFLRENSVKAKMAALFFSLVDKVMQPWDKNPDIFYLLQEGIQSLGQENGPKSLYVFLIKFLTLSGFKPELNCCICCHSQLEDEICFSVSRGGLLCRKCLGQESGVQKISRQAASSLRYIQRTDYPLVYRLNPTSAC